MSTRLAVLGSPIAHSQSPALHAAAYGVLGLDWQYEAIDVTEGDLRRFVRERGPEWRGLSLTMPLKREVLGLLDEIDPVAVLTQAANTVLLTDGHRRGFNTDVYGITRAFRDAGVDALHSVRILGGGATAASVLVAVQRLGATTVTVSLRSPGKAAPLIELAAALGVSITIEQLGGAGGPVDVVDAVVSTLPGHAAHEVEFPITVRRSAVLFDVAYSPWPSTFASAWLEAGGTVISGLEMLVNQALAQVRIFVGGDPQQVLPEEEAVLAAMRAAVHA